MMNVLFWAALAVGVSYGIFTLPGPQSAYRAIVKTSPLLLLATASAFVFAPWLLVLALLLSAIGDWFLSFRSDRNFIAGLAAFLLAHVAYAVLFISQWQVPSGNVLYFVLASLAVLLLAVTVFGRLRPHLGSMTVPVAAYTCVITAMAITSFARGFDPVLIAGVLLFISSDLVLAFERFVFDEGEHEWSGRYIWFAYLFGQALIVASYIL